MTRIKTLYKKNHFLPSSARIETAVGSVQTNSRPSPGMWLYTCRKRKKAVQRFLIDSRLKRPVVSTWNSAIYEVIKHVPHTCLFGYA